MTATDLPAKPYRNTAFDASINNPSAYASTLDDSFAAIDWQASWLCHLNQLGYISKSISQLRGLKNDPAQTEKLEHTPDIIAKVLNTALQKHHELSAFVKVTDKANNDARWYFLDPTVSMTVTQKQPCICGSGEKFKRCCGAYI